MPCYRTPFQVFDGFNQQIPEWALRDLSFSETCTPFQAFAGFNQQIPEGALRILSFTGFKCLTVSTNKSGRGPPGFVIQRNINGLAATAVRDGQYSTFEFHTSALIALLCNVGELPTDSNCTLRLRRVKSSTVKRSFFHLVADLSDGTTTNELSLKKACRVAFGS